MEERNELVSIFFTLGMSQPDILKALASYGYIVSQRHLRRILASSSLFRKKGYSDIADVIHFIQDILSVSGLHGYRWMCKKGIESGLKVRCDDVQQILKILDPEGTEFR